MKTQLKSNPTYTDVKEYTESHRSSRVGNNTTLEHGFLDGQPEENRPIVMKLHGNEIIRWYPDGTIAISDGGYASVTTKQRLNQFTNARVFQKNHDWYYRAPDGSTQPFKHAADGQPAHMYYSRNCARAWNIIQNPAE
jgi:hypothetical protein